MVAWPLLSTLFGQKKGAQMLSSQADAAYRDDRVKAR
jgi:hypothetical protein